MRLDKFTLRGQEAFKRPFEVADASESKGRAGPLSSQCSNSPKNRAARARQAGRERAGRCVLTTVRLPLSVLSRRAGRQAILQTGPLSQVFISPPPRYRRAMQTIHLDSRIAAASQEREGGDAGKSCGRTASTVKGPLESD